MFTIVLFSLLQVLASGYAVWRGGAPERTVGAVLAIACVASVLTPLLPAFTYRGVNVPMLRVDLVLMVALTTVALTADRFWPMWLAALQLVAIGTHGVRVYSPDIVPNAYWWLSSKIGYPMLLLLVIGTYRHCARTRGGLREHSWTSQRLRDDREGRAAPASSLHR